MGIQVCGDFQQRSEKFEVGPAAGMLATKILHRSRPIDVGEKAFIAETGALQYFWRTDVEHVFQGRLRTKAIDGLEHEHTGSEKNAQADAC
jgi:hypothetical protein